MLDDGNDKKYCTTRKEFQFGKIEKKLQTCGTVAVLQREHIEWQASRQLKWFRRMTFIFCRPYLNQQLIA